MAPFGAVTRGDFASLRLFDNRRLLFRCHLCQRFELASLIERRPDYGLEILRSDGLAARG
jgi:hypothetical protein